MPVLECETSYALPLHEAKFARLIRYGQPGGDQECAALLSMFVDMVGKRGSAIGCNNWSWAIRLAPQENAIGITYFSRNPLSEKEVLVCWPYPASLCDIINDGGRLRTVGWAVTPAFGSPQLNLCLLSFRKLLS